MAEDKCICHLDGYELKDAEARQSIEALEKRLGITNKESEVTNNE